VNTRQQILKATERVILSKGLARVTTKEIARAAGYAEGTLYKHFETKEDLFLAVIQESLPDFVETVQEDRAGKATVQANLEEIAHATINYYDKLMPLVVSLFADADLLTRHREWMQTQNAGPMRIYERVAAYVEAEQHLDRIDIQRDPFCVAALLLGPCFQYVFLRCFMGVDPSTMTQQKFVSELVQTLISGVCPVDR
jgi:AcrR family transcriptional regulator